MDPTKATQWIATTFRELPSGNVAKVKKIDLIDLVGRGTIPDTLTGEVDKLLKGGGGKVTLDATHFDTKGFQNFLELADLVCQVSFIEPQLVATEAEEDLEAGKIWVKNISWADRFDVFTWANERAETVRPFREKPAPDVESMEPSHSVQPAAQPPPRPAAVLVGGVPVRLGSDVSGAGG
jgi:hypothetical protein